MKCLGDFWNSNILGCIFLNIKIKLTGFPIQKKMQDETNSTLLCLFIKQSHLLQRDQNVALLVFTVFTYVSVFVVRSFKQAQ